MWTETSVTPEVRKASELKALGCCYHVDLYRLDTEEQVESCGFWELFELQEGLVFVEWPERFNLEDLPQDWNLLNLVLKTKSANLREVLKV